MRVVAALDSFKGSLSSIEAGAAVKEAVLRVDRNAEVIICPLADGGEGTVEALSAGLGGTPIDVEVCGPLGNPVTARYALLPNGTAVIEMAAAAGIRPLTASVMVLITESTREGSVGSSVTFV